MDDHSSVADDVSHSRLNQGRRGSSFLSSIFGRSISISESTTTDYPPEFVVGQTGGRQRGYSESSLEDFDDDIRSPDLLRQRSTTTTDGSAISADRPRPRSLTLSAMLLGSRTPESLSNPTSPITVTDPTHSLTDQNNQTNDSGVSVSQVNSTASRETSQTDHLNKKLLNSFLTRINSVAATIIDPSGSGEGIGQVYTDDVMMDRILRRVEGDKKP